MSERNFNLIKLAQATATKQTMGSSSSGSRNDTKEQPASNSQHSTVCKSTPARKSIQDIAMISSRSNIGESDSGTGQQAPNETTSSSNSTRPETSPQTNSNNNNNATTDNLGLDQSAQLRSTLAIGQLIASNRPTAGSRLIANELKQLSKTIREESVSIRKEVANLSSNLATTLKRVLDDDREQRNLSATGGLARRPMFGSFAARRFPVFRRPRRPPIQAMRRYSATDATSSPNQPSPLQASSAGTSGSSNNVASKTTTSTGTQTPEIIIGPTSQKQVAAMKLSNLASAATKSPTASMSAAKALAMVFKGPWLTLDRSYDGEVDTDSNETTPSSSP